MEGLLDAYFRESSGRIEVTPIGNTLPSAETVLKFDPISRVRQRPRLTVLPSETLQLGL